MPAGTLELTDSDWASLLDLADAGLDSSDDFEDNADLLGMSDELTRVSRKISGQYADVIASFAGQAFRGRAGRDAAEQASAALEALVRLAEASGDHIQGEMLAELRQLIPDAAHARRNSRARNRALASLRDWIPRFATTLQADDAQRLLDLVTWDHSAPLMEELSSIRGIGPKRLGRLYAAGLHTVEIVAHANPVEVAQVTGLPQDLSSRVVDATKVFAVEERRRCLEQLRDRARRLREVLRSVETSDPEVQRLTEEAFREVELTFQQLNPGENP